MKLTNKRFTTRTLRVLFLLLPRRIKRLIFLSSIAGKVIGEVQVDNEVLLKLQEKFSLCRYPDAINLPLALNGKIWSKKPIDELVCQEHLCSLHSQHDFTRNARQIVAKMPCYLVYDETMKIVREVRELLTVREELFHAKQTA